MYCLAEKLLHTKQLLCLHEKQYVDWPQEATARTNLVGVEEDCSLV